MKKKFYLILSALIITLGVTAQSRVYNMKPHTRNSTSQKKKVRIPSSYSTPELRLDTSGLESSFFYGGDGTIQTQEYYTFNSLGLIETLKYTDYDDDGTKWEGYLKYVYDNQGRLSTMTEFDQDANGEWTVGRDITEYVYTETGKKETYKSLTSGKIYSVYNYLHEQQIPLPDGRNIELVLLQYSSPNSSNELVVEETEISISLDGWGLYFYWAEQIDDFPVEYDKEGRITFLGIFELTYDKNGLTYAVSPEDVECKITYDASGNMTLMDFNEYNEASGKFVDLYDEKDTYANGKLIESVFNYTDGKTANAKKTYSYGNKAYPEMYKEFEYLTSVSAWSITRYAISHPHDKLSDLETVESLEVTENNGSFDLSTQSFATNAAFTGTFTLVLPKGFTLDTQNTAMVDELFADYGLSSTALPNNTWSFLIEPFDNATAVKGTFLTIAYTVDKDVVTGEYTAEIKDLFLSQGRETRIIEENLSTTLHVDRTGTSNQSIDTTTATRVYTDAGVLRVETEQSVQLNVYTVSGRCLVSKQISNTENINLPQGAYIVKAGNEIFKVVIP